MNIHELPMKIKSLQQKYQMDMGILIFGAPLDFDASSTINEFKTFIESNSNLVLNMTTSNHPALSNSEIAYQSWCNGNTGGYAPMPSSLSSSNLALFPPSGTVKSLFVLYNYNNLLPLCYLGGTLGFDRGINGASITFVPLGYSGYNNSGPNWQYHIAQVMVHEFLNQLNTWMGLSGIYTFPSPEICTLPPDQNHGCGGYTQALDWKDCYQCILAALTPTGYSLLGTPITTTPTPPPTGGCPSGQMLIPGTTNCVPTLYLVAGSLGFVALTIIKK